MHTQDEMTPKERSEARQKGLACDRLPIGLMFNSAAGILNNMTYRQMFSSARNYAECQIAAYRRFGYDSVSVSYGMHGIGIGLGAELTQTEDNVPSIKTYPILGKADLAKLDQELFRPENNTMARQAMEAADIILDTIGNEVSVGIAFPGPATAVVSMVGMENFLTWLLRDPEFLQTLFAFAKETVVQLAAPFIQAGVNVSLSDPAASGMILGARRYKQQILPWTQQIFQSFAQMGAKKRGYHVCGDTTATLQEMSKSGATGISLDNKVSLAYAREHIGENVHISGNIDPVSVIRDGTAEDIRLAVEKAFQECGRSPGGFTISSGCGVPMGTPMKQLDAYIRSAKHYARLYCTMI